MFSPAGDRAGARPLRGCLDDVTKVEGTAAVVGEDGAEVEGARVDRRTYPRAR